MNHFNHFYTADLLGRTLTMNNFVDWLQLFINTIIAGATVWALFTAIKSAKASIKSSEETAEFSRETLREAEENRKDDVMPILQMLTRHNPQTSQESIHLKNVGQGPLFDFKVIKPRYGLLVAKAEIEATGGLIYYVVARQDDLLGAKNETYVTYSYKDMYGREFTQRHKFYRADNTIRAENELDIPVKVLKKIRTK
jgi:hypothetical protein